MANWERYAMTPAQLKAYLQLFTGKDDITIQDAPTGPYTPNRAAVRIPVSDPNAPMLATHEGVHINQTTAPTVGTDFAYLTGVQQTVLDILEDGRAERHQARSKPGIRGQFQEVADELFPLLVAEPWVPQALKAMYLDIAGYRYDRSKLKPKARKVLNKFDGLVPDVRRAATTSDLVPFVDKVISLFDEDIPEPPPPPIGNGPGRGPAKDDDPQGGNRQGNAQGGQGQGQDGSGQPQPGSNGQGQPGQGQPGRSQPGQGGEDQDGNDGQGNGKGKAGDGQANGGSSSGPSGKGQGQPQTGNGSGGWDAGGGNSYDAGSSDASGDGSEWDDFDSEADNSSGGGAAYSNPFNEDEDDGDPANGDPPTIQKVTGGPSANALLSRAKSYQKRLSALEAKGREIASGNIIPTQPDISTRPNAGSDKNRSFDETNLPKGMKPLANVDDLLKRYPGGSPSARTDYNYRTGEYEVKENGNPDTIILDFDALTGAKVKGRSGIGVGYNGKGTASIKSARLGTGVYAAEAKNIHLAFSPTINYLSRQLRVFMQSADRKGVRDYERSGLIDKRRAYQMGTARFDVYRQPPNPRDSRPVVLLTTDLSSSMGGGNGGWGNSIYRNVPSYHAMSASIVLGAALAKLGIPFEMHGFYTAGYTGNTIPVFKTFRDPFDANAIGALGNIYAMCAGGTPAAEALAVAWSRLMLRPEPRRILIQVTDGGVADNTRELAFAIEKQGGIVIAVGIGTNGAVKGMFPNSVEIQDASQLPMVFMRLLRTLLPNGEWKPTRKVMR